MHTILYLTAKLIYALPLNIQLCRTIISANQPVYHFKNPTVLSLFQNPNPNPLIPSKFWPPISKTNKNQNTQSLNKSKHPVLKQTEKDEEEWRTKNKVGYLVGDELVKEKSEPAKWPNAEREAVSPWESIVQCWVRSEKRRLGLRGKPEKPGQQNSSYKDKKPPSYFSS